MNGVALVVLVVAAGAALVAIGLMAAGVVTVRVSEPRVGWRWPEWWRWAGMGAAAVLFWLADDVASRMMLACAFLAFAVKISTGPIRTRWD